MAQVTVTVAGRAYRLGCDPGEEAHVAELGRALDGRIGELRQQLGEVGDLRLLVMAGITILDSLHEARAEIARLNSSSESVEDATALAEARLLQAETEAAGRVGRLAERLERLARELAEETRQ
jgi:cell division protein ZapA